MNEQPTDWHDLRLILAIARAGSLSGAARELAISHATVFRRLGTVEKRLGVRLFERGRAGYSPTAAGEDVAAAAARIETEVQGIERRVAGRDLLPSGVVRVTTTDSLLHYLLTPVFAGFRRDYPDIELEVAVSPVLFSLAKREADVAIRPTAAPPESLVGRRIGRIGQAVYGRAGAFDGDSPASGLASLQWVGPDARMGFTQLERWMRDQKLDARCRYRVDTGSGMIAAVAEGLGVAVLPCYAADADPRLVRLGDTIPALHVDLWLLTHPDLRQAARIRAFNTFIASALQDLGHRLCPAAGASRTGNLLK